MARKPNSSTTKPADAKAPVPKNAEKLAPATEIEASGAIIEPAIVERVEMAHPAVDSNPRERSSAEMNQIDFNTPSALTTQEDEVEQELKNG